MKIQTEMFLTKTSQGCLARIVFQTLNKNKRFLKSDFKKLLAFTFVVKCYSKSTLILIKITKKFSQFQECHTSLMSFLNISCKTTTIHFLLL